MLILLSLIILLRSTSAIKLGNRFEFTYTLLDSTFVRLELTCTTPFWCAVGFGDSMTNADIILVYQSSPGVIEVRD
jgi:hypothetical protein